MGCRPPSRQLRGGGKPLIVKMLKNKTKNRRLITAQQKWQRMAFGLPALNNIRTLRRVLNGKRKMVLKIFFAIKCHSANKVSDCH